MSAEFGEGYIDEDIASTFSSGVAKPSGISVVGSRYENPMTYELIDALDQAEEVGAISVFAADAGRDYYRLWSLVSGLYDHDDDLNTQMDPAERIAELDHSLELKSPPALLIHALPEEQGGFLVYALSDDPELNGSIDINFAVHISPDTVEHATVQAAHLGTKLPTDIDPIRIPMEYGPDFVQFADLLTSVYDAYDSGKIDTDQYEALNKALAIIKLNRGDFGDLVRFEGSEDSRYEDAVFYFPQTGEDGEA